MIFFLFPRFRSHVVDVVVAVGVSFDAVVVIFLLLKFFKTYLNRIQ